MTADTITDRSEIIIPRGAKRELRMTLNTHGRWICREWFQSRAGLMPGRGGIELNVREIRSLYEAVEAVQAKPKEG